VYCTVCSKRCPRPTELEIGGFYKQGAMIAFGSCCYVIKRRLVRWEYLTGLFVRCGACLEAAQRPRLSAWFEDAPFRPLIDTIYGPRQRGYLSHRFEFEILEKRHGAYYLSARQVCTGRTWEYMFGVSEPRPLEVERLLLAYDCPEWLAEGLVKRYFDSGERLIWLI